MANHQSLGPFSEPLASWGNDDLLVSESSRKDLGAQDPALLAVLDWPELRALFELHDAPANAARRRLKVSGRTVFAVMVLGLVAGIVAQQFSAVAGADKLRWEEIALFAAILSVAAASLAWIVGIPTRSRWLINRIWTERLRQLNFQLLLNHLPVVSVALAECAGGAASPPGPALSAWQALRARALQRFEAQLSGNEAYAIDQLAGDQAEVQTWIDPAWERASDPAAAGKEGERMIDLLGSQRIGVQLEYVRKKLREGMTSPSTQRNFIRTVALIFSVLAVFSGLAAIPLVIIDHKAWFIPMLLAQGVFSGAVVLVNAFDKGMAISDDADRYEWYLALLEQLKTRFEYASDQAGRLEALRALEVASYVEMRRFFVAHRSGRSFN